MDLEVDVNPPSVTDKNVVIHRNNGQLISNTHLMLKRTIVVPPPKVKDNLLLDGCSTYGSSYAKLFTLLLPTIAF